MHLDSIGWVGVVVVGRVLVVEGPAATTLWWWW
jgi:hypothetical protein